MCFFYKRANSNKKPRLPVIIDTIQRILEVEELLKHRSRQLKLLVIAEIKIIRENVDVDKPTALRALERRKSLTRKLIEIENTWSILRFTRDKLENINSNIRLRKVLGDAAVAFQNANQILSEDDAECDKACSLSNEDTDIDIEIENEIEFWMGVDVE